MWTTNTNAHNRDFRAGDWTLRSDTLCVVATSEWTGGEWYACYAGEYEYGDDRDETCAAALAKYVRGLVDSGGGAGG